jgi:hypothetical protein
MVTLNESPRVGIRIHDAKIVMLVDLQRGVFVLLRVDLSFSVFKVHANEEANKECGYGTKEELLDIHLFCIEICKK